MLLDRYQGIVYGLCYRMMRHRQDAEDVVQETFLRALNGIRGFDAERPFRPWLLGIAANRCRPPSIGGGGGDGGRGVRGPGGPPGRPERPRRHRRGVAEGFGATPPNYRLAFVLFHEQGLSYEEIALVMGKPVGTIKTWLHRARAELAEDLTRPRRELLNDRLGPGPEPAIDRIEAPPGGRKRVDEVMNCLDYDRWLDEMFDSRATIPEAPGAGLELHLSTCERCRSSWAGALLLHQAITNWPATPPASPASMARLRELRVPGPYPRRPSRFLRIALPLSAAAALLLAFVGDHANRRIARIRDGRTPPAGPLALRPLARACGRSRRPRCSEGRSAGSPWWAWTSPGRPRRPSPGSGGMPSGRKNGPSPGPSSPSKHAGPPGRAAPRPIDPPGKSLNEGVKPFSDSARHAFSFLLGPASNPEPAAPAEADTR